MSIEDDIRMLAAKAQVAREPVVPVSSYDQRGELQRQRENVVWQIKSDAFRQAVQLGIVLPKLEEVARLLNNLGQKAGNGVWEIKDLRGVEEYQIIPSGEEPDMPDPDYCAFNGSVLQRKIGVGTRVIQEGGFLRRRLTEDYSIYDMIFVGYEGDGKDKAEDVDVESVRDEWLHVSHFQGRINSLGKLDMISGNDVLDFPKICIHDMLKPKPNEVADLDFGLREITDSNSSLHIALGQQVEERLLAALKVLPEFAVK
jgi:hypothetical protein